MAIENAISFLRRVETDTALQACVQCIEDAIRVGAENGLVFTHHELNQAFDQFYGDLSPEELKKSVGGWYYW